MDEDFEASGGSRAEPGLMPLEAREFGLGLAAHLSGIVDAQIPPRIRQLLEQIDGGPAPEAAAGH